MFTRTLLAAALAAATLTMTPAVMRPAWSYGMRGEIRAGWLDARRTSRPRPWHGRRYGDPFYALGYALGALA